MNVNEAREVLRERSREKILQEMKAPGGLTVALSPAWTNNERDLPSIDVTLLADGTWVWT